MNYLLYIGTLGLLGVSYVKDKKKTRMALKKAWKAFENILPEFLVVILIVGIMIALLNPTVISSIIVLNPDGLGLHLRHWLAQSH